MPGRSQPNTIVGRDAELQALGKLLDDLTAATGLLLHGPRGTGMSALIQAGAEGAQRRGFTVLQTSGAEAEQHLEYAGLHQLLRPLKGRLAALPPAQQDALGAVFGLADDAAPDVFRAGIATLTLLTTVAREQSVLLCIDDAQWLDGTTVDVLSFLARRSGDQAIGVLAGTHAIDPGSFVDVAFQTLHLTPLDAVSAAAMLDEREPTLNAFVRERVLREAAGSPLAIAELPDAFRAAGDDVLLSAWAPVPAVLEEAFAGGLDELPPATRMVLLAAALNDGSSAAEALQAASAVAGHEITIAGLAPAVAAHLVAMHGDRLRFSHRLTRSAVRRCATVGERTATHHALATVLAADADRRTWHRSVVTVEPDEALASELDVAAHRAQQAGSYDRAAAGYRRAARLSTSPATRHRRLVHAAELAREIGSVGVAGHLASGLYSAELDAPTHARFMALRERLEPTLHGDDAHVRTLLDAAAAAADAGDTDSALCLIWIAASAFSAAGRRGHAEPRISALAECIAQTPTCPWLISILASVAPPSWNCELLTRAAQHPPDSTKPDAMSLLGQATLAVGDPHAAVEFLEAATVGFQAHGRMTPLSQAQALLSQALFETSRWHAADRTAQRAHQGALQTGQAVWASLSSAVLANTAALRHDERAVENHGAAAERLAIPLGLSPVLGLVQQARGSAALAAGRLEEAFGHCSRVFDPSDAAHDRPTMLRLIGDLAEAASTDAQRLEVQRNLDELGTNSSAAAPQEFVGRAHAAVVLGGDDDAARAFASFAARGPERWPFQDARIRLAYGMRLRRQRRVADSRGPLRDAQALFEQLGAAQWSARAHQELGATVESSRRGSDATEQLTPQELVIAQLAAQGLTNREIAAQLQLSHRTVGSHLSRIFPKLGVTTRHQISAALTAVRTPETVRRA